MRLHVERAVKAVLKPPQDLRISGLRSPKETVSHIVRVDIIPGDRTDRIVGKRDGALERACARARNVERGDRAVRGAHEAVIDVARVDILSRDRPWRVDAEG